MSLNSYANMNIAQAAVRAGFDPYVMGELAKRIDFLEECPWYAAEHGSYHKHLQATRLGTGTFGTANSPVPTISSGAAYLTEPVKLYEADSVIDDRVVKTADDPTSVRDSEDYLNLQGITQDWLYQLFYNLDYVTLDGFKSFVQRRAAVATNRVWDAGGGGGGSVHTSLWMMEFGPHALHLRFRKGGMPGFENQDRGLNSVPAPTGSGNFWAWVRHYEIYAAIVLRDDRALLREGAIEVTGSSNIFDPAIAIAMKNQLPSFGKDACIFVNRTLKTQIDNNVYAKTNMALTIKDVQNFGPITHVADVPVRVHEGITNTEADI